MRVVFINRILEYELHEGHSSNIIQVLNIHYSVKCVFMYLGHGKPIYMYPDLMSLAPLELLLFKNEKKMDSGKLSVKKVALTYCCIHV